MKKEPNSIASLTLGIIKVFSSSRAQSANATKRSGVQFFPFTSAFNCATTGWRKAKTRRGIFTLLLCLLKKLLYVLSLQALFLSIEKAERLNSRQLQSYCGVISVFLHRRSPLQKIIRTPICFQGSYYLHVVDTLVRCPNN